jgi:3-methyl-2-oxobutanoate hydroxymethyltransferase
MRITLKDLLNKKGKTPIVMATAYDAWTAKIVDEAVDCILVGDSLGMVVQGHDTTIPVTMEDMIYHTRMVVRGSKNAFVISDLPFLSYQCSISEAVYSAGQCLKEGYAQAVKLEGGEFVVPQIKAMTQSGIPVVAHLGLTPQSINVFGGYDKRAKSKSASDQLIKDAEMVEMAGANMLVLENIPYDLAKQVSEHLTIPTIGIGAGADCDGQVQVFHDLFGLNPDFTPRHATKFANCGRDMVNGIQKFAKEVRSGKFMSK